MTQTLYLETKCDGDSCDRVQRVVLDHRDHNFQAPPNWTKIVYENDTWVAAQVEHLCEACAGVLMARFEPFPKRGPRGPGDIGQ